MNASEINIIYSNKFLTSYFQFVENESNDNFDKSSFIESILLNLPLGNLIIDYNGFVKIYDGYSRVFSVKDFVENNFKLEDLKILSILNGKYFSELDGNLQRQILETKIDVIQLNYMSTELKREILNKLDK